jgi:hypothetical protein
MPDGDGTAELVLLDLRIEPGSPQPGDQVTLIAEGANSGAIDSGPFEAGYHLGNDDGGSTDSNMSWPSLSPGERHTEQWQVPIRLQPGSYTCSVTLDINNQVGEQNKEDNGRYYNFDVGAPPTPMALSDKNQEEENLHSGSVTVKKEEEEVIVPHPHAELSITVISLSADKLRNTDAFIVGALVHNDGKLQSGQFNVRFRMDGEDPFDYVVDNIAPKERKTAELRHDPITAGQHTVSVQVDPENRVEEGNKDDNSMSLTFPVEEAPENIRIRPEEEEPIHPSGAEMGAGMEAKDAIANILNRYHDAIIELWTEYYEGLGDFQRDLTFPSVQEAEFDVNAVMKGAVKGLFWDSLKEVAGLAPGGAKEILKPLVGAIKGGVDAYFAEKDRSAHAKDMNELNEFIRQVEDEIDAGRKGMGENILAQQGPVMDEFAQAIANDPQHGRATSGGRLEGPGGQLVLDLLQQLAVFQQHMPGRKEFERQITEAWIKNVKWTTTVEGHLIFHLDLYRLTPGWAPKQTDNAWTVESDAPGNRTRVAEALRHSLGGKRVTEVALPKIVYLTLSNDPDWDPFIKGEIRFTLDDLHPKEITAVKTDMEINEAENLLTEVWEKPSTREYALKWTDIIG